MNHRKRLFIRLSAVIGGLVGVSAGYAQTVPFALVSLRSDGTPPAFTGAAGSENAVTPDGRYVAFSMSVDHFVPGVTNAQVYLRDRQSGTIELISQSTAGVPANGNSTNNVSISNDGCRVVFESYASNLVVGDNNGTSNVFVRNRCAQPQTTEMVDVLPNGSPGPGQGQSGRISGDGSKVAFTSYTSNLVPGLLDSNGFACSDGVYIRNLNTGVTTGLTLDNGRCVSGRVPDLSRDGSKIAFFSTVPYVTADTNGMWDIYAYDFAAPIDRLSLVSSNTAGAPQQQNDGVNGGEGISTITAPAISEDGRIVAFRSRGFGLVAGVPSGISQVYVKDTATGDIIVASVDAHGVLGNADSLSSGSGERPGISGDGQFVVFNTLATNLTPVTGGTTPNVVMHDNFRSRTIGFTNQSVSGVPTISGDPLGRYVAFYSGNALDPSFNSRGFFLTDRYLWLNFSDVPANNWALAYINALLDMGITTGCGSGNYCPSQFVTREQMAAFIVRVKEGEPTAGCTSQPFNDVPTSNFFCKYIQRMSALGVTTGCGNGNYCPSQNVTREQMAAFIIRAREGNPAAGYCGSTAPFLDVDTTNVFCGHIKRLLELHITTGCGPGNYCPSQNVTREQMAAFLARAFLGMR